jgi:S1-C subfamily serine protease
MPVAPQTGPPPPAQAVPGTPKPRWPGTPPGGLYSLDEPWRVSLVDVQGRGVMIERLDIRSFAAPLLQPGDILIRVDDRPVTTSKEVEQYLQTVPPGSLVVVTVRRDNAIHYVMLQVPAPEESRGGGRAPP